MNLREFIESGIIEMYCMGIASEEETVLVEKMAAAHEEVRKEIMEVNDALEKYSSASEKSPAHILRNKILSGIIHAEEIKEFSFPPPIFNSSIYDWQNYIRENNITGPAEYESIHALDLPGNSTQTTYIVWAKKGAVVEESHDDEDEYLFMLKGYCSVTIDGKIGYYREGDLVYIPRNAVHRAEALSDEPMIVIGQRIAA
jgi:quercetin dioxygenase-like cupin family protein